MYINGVKKSTGLGVNKDGRALTQTVNVHVALEEALNGNAFTLSDATVTPGAGHYFAHVENLSTYPLVVTRIEFTDAGAEHIVVGVTPSYTPVGSGAGDAAQNRLVGSPKRFALRGNWLLGDDITGQGTVTGVRTIPAGAATLTVEDLEANPLVLGQNQVLLLQAITGGNIVTNVRIDCYFLETERVDG